MVNFAKIISPLLGLTVLLTGMGQSPLNAQLSPNQLESLMTQTLETANNERLVQQSLTTLDLLKTGKYQEARRFLSPELSKRISQEEIATFWENITNRRGEVKKYNDTEVINTLDADIVVIDTQFTNSQEDIVITYNKEGQIIGVNFIGLESVEEMAEGFIQALMKKDYNAARSNLHPFLKAELFSAQIQDKWESVIAEYGNGKKIEEITIVPSFGGGSGKLVTVTVQFEKRSDDVLIIFDENQLITGVDMAVD
ncbi:MAG: DUF3887 domain-containing protein [Microcystaceae cyanobacterium]